MAKTTLKRTIHAPVEDVFSAVADASVFSQAVPDVLSIEYLSASRMGTGTKFRETRILNGKMAANVMHVTEFVKNSMVRIESENAGTVWDSVFSVQVSGNDTELSLVMEARSSRVMSKLFNSLLMPVIKKSAAKDLDAIKLFCEESAV